MLIKYLGPGATIKVPPHGEHSRNETKEYPNEFGRDLIITSKKQRFKKVEGAGTKAQAEANKKTRAKANANKKKD